MKQLNKIKAITMAAVLSLAVAAPIAFAQSTDDSAGVKKERREHRGRHNRRGGSLMGFRNLDLTDAQKTQMKQIRESHRQAVAPLIEQIRASRQEIRQASQGDTFNEALVAQKLSEIAPLEAKLMGEHARIRQETLSVLTPEQKAKLDQAREQFKSRRAGRRANKQK